MVIAGTYPARTDAEPPAARVPSTSRAGARLLVDEADAEDAAAILADPS